MLIIWSMSSSLTYANLVSAIFRKAECHGLFCFKEIMGMTNPMRSLQTHDNEHQRAPVISYEELLGDSDSVHNNISYGKSKTMLITL